MINALKCGETVSATSALTPAANRAAFFGETRIDNLRVVDVA